MSTPILDPSLPADHSRKGSSLYIAYLLSNSETPLPITAGGSSPHRREQAETRLFRKVGV